MRYLDLVSIYQQLESAPKRLQKTHIISEFLKAAEDLEMTVLLLEGRIFPDYDERKIGVAARLVIKAISVATGMTLASIEESWKKHGDLGTTASELTKTKTQATLSSTVLSIKYVFETLRKLCLIDGIGAAERKTKLIAQLLSSATPEESKYIIRTVLEDLRIGVGEGIIRDALVWAYVESAGYDEKSGKLNIPDREHYNHIVQRVQSGYDLVLDWGEIAGILREKNLDGLSELSLKVGRPIRAMLFLKAKDIEDAFKRVGKPAAFEFKYDGFRLQIHKKNNRILLFTRRQEDVTLQFPDIVEDVKDSINIQECILDSEVVGIDRKTGKYLPFQAISQRIRRKHGISRVSRDFPVQVNVFDIMFLDGKNMLKTPFKSRREHLSKIIRHSRIALSRQILTDDSKVATKFYELALNTGNEGVMAKNLDAIYIPGSRVGFGVKVKPVMESLDLVIVRAEWGEGKRASWLTSFTLACMGNDGLQEIGKVSTGFKELAIEGTSYEEMTNMLRPLIVEEKGRDVRIKPEVVIEVNFEEIQKSTRYSSGFALRFPRFIRLRDDRMPQEIDTVESVESAYKVQRHR